MVKIRRRTAYMVILSYTLVIGCGINKTDHSLSVDHQSVTIQTEQLSLQEALPAHNHLPVSERIALYHERKKDQSNKKNEDVLNLYGYSLLWDNKVSEAIEIFKLVVSEFPHSSNAYDSLGEAYMVNGDKKLSVLNYSKSLELDPDNFNAEEQIERIKYPDRVPETPAEKFVKTYTKKEYLEDLDQLGKKLIEVNPNALKFISNENFWKVIEDKKALITDYTTYGEFRWHCNEIVANANCSHTSMGDFYPENEMIPTRLRFPALTRLVKNQLFVIDPLNNTDKIDVKDEIEQINGIPVSLLLNDIYRHIPSQGYTETPKKHYFNRWSSGLIAYALSFPDKYVIHVKGQEDPIFLNKAKSSKEPVNDGSIPRCSNNLCLEFIENTRNAVMTISSFNYYRWNNYKEFTKFMDQSFEKINNRSIENLILDLRFNGGGSPESSIYLLKYLAKKPFTYFADTDYPEGQGIQEPFNNTYKGRLYFIIDGNGSSTTGHFMATVKDLGLGTIVGEELGSNQFCTGGQTTCRLSNTKLRFYVGNSTSKLTITSLPDETGILPDHHVTQSIDDYLNRVDAVKNYTLNLISQ